MQSIEDDYLLKCGYSREEIFESLDRTQEIYEKKYSDSNNENWREVGND